ncbi:hypothetical protein [Yersinia proxima]|uniref:hypothetical protein n=1 Tax=Yersinia proxima TaxID=2890316 RepID=UPI0005E37318|nr:hypothetical protein [Yersinia proxima]CNK85984.1 Uncharacterised protein [Yersinia intermedia]
MISYQYLEMAYQMSTYPGDMRLMRNQHFICYGRCGKVAEIVSEKNINVEAKNSWQPSLSGGEEMCIHVVVRQGRFTIYWKGDYHITVCAQIVNTL